jgi:transcriptional regulator with XRE-family HTH domain
MIAMPAETGPHARPGRPRAGEVDVLIGRRVRERRLMLGITVQELAAVLGVPYQQVHKYETGANRLSAGRLYRLGEALGVEVGHFFGEDGAGGDASPTAQRRMLLDLVRNFARIPDRRQQEALACLARTLAGLGETAGEDRPADVQVAVGP